MVPTTWQTRSHRLACPACVLQAFAGEGSCCLHAPGAQTALPPRASLQVPSAVRGAAHLDGFHRRRRVPYVQARRLRARPGMLGSAWAGATGVGAFLRPGRGSPRCILLCGCLWTSIAWTPGAVVAHKACAGAGMLAVGDGWLRFAICPVHAGTRGRLCKACHVSSPSLLGQRHRRMRTRVRLHLHCAAQSQPSPASLSDFRPSLTL